jgi:putative transposase
MTRKLESGAHTKHLILYHFIFVCKYRRKVFTDPKVAQELKNLMTQCASQHEFTIETMEIDKTMPDHFHCLIRSKPSIAPYEIAHDLKQYSTYNLWKIQEPYLKKFYWKEHLLWTRGYFVSTVGNVSADMLQKYIDEQGSD